tara:strand:- start:143 stop:370 length:228 start_codon:yes stop_codon:yes gene_type:complete
MFKKLTLRHEMNELTHEYIKSLRAENEYLESKVDKLNEEMEGLKLLVADYVDNTKRQNRQIEKHQNIRRSQGSLI